ncbi:hypothetical protein BDY24DRAFT_417099 [Mrakia frigida]|uniref:uncharacterized protein n=1 Tax=Mrakia frigida TaxID=29902 RepID=UPI003FCC0D62
MKIFSKDVLPISNDLLPSLPFLETMTSSSYSSCLPHSLPLEVIEKIFLLAFTPSTPLTIYSSSITPPPSSHNFLLVSRRSLLPLHHHPPSSRLRLLLRSQSRTLRRWRTGSSDSMVVWKKMFEGSFTDERAIEDLSIHKPGEHEERSGDQQWSVGGLCLNPQDWEGRRVWAVGGTQMFSVDDSFVEELWAKAQKIVYAGLVESK